MEKPTTSKSQRDRFIETARQLGADEDIRVQGQAGGDRAAEAEG